MSEARGTAAHRRRRQGVSNGADPNPAETSEWLESLENILEHDGIERANFLLERLSSRLTETGAPLPYTVTTPYRNTIPAHKEAFMPGDLFMERRIRSLIRWNALAMVVRANRRNADLGGHISTFASAATSTTSASTTSSVLRRTSSRRPHLLPGSQLTGDLRALVP